VVLQSLLATCMGKSLLIVVPARRSSKRLPGKNRLLLGGAPLAAWTQAAIDADNLRAPILLTTDDPELIRTGRNLGWMAPFIRPEFLARDDTPTAGAVLHALDWWRSEHGGDPDLVLLLQLTSPFRPHGFLRKALSTAEEDDTVAAVVAMKTLSVPPGKVYLDRNPITPLIAKDMDTRDRALVPSGALYLVRTEVFRATGDFVPPGTAAQVHDGISTLDLDTIADLRTAESIIAFGDWNGPAPHADPSNPPSVA